MGLQAPTTHTRYRCFDLMVGFEWSNDSDGYAGGNVAIGRAFNADMKNEMILT